jgi:cytochrome d ubiquinol oxidase subunit I
MEGNWETGPNIPLVLFAIPDEAARENKFEIAIPNGASLILKHKASGVVPGLNDFVAEDGTKLHPRVAPVFFSFRIMIGTGVAMLALSWFGLFLLRRYGAGQMPRLPLFAFAAMSFSGWIATLAGWYTTEIGRQPWLVHGVLSTKDAVSDVPAGMVLGTLIGYLVVYAALILAYIGVITYLARKATRGEALSTRRYPRSGEAEVALMQPGE